MLERPTPAPAVVVEDLDDDVCLYRGDINEVLVLNQTAGDVWRLADGSATVEGIVELLAHAYGADPADIRGDVATVVDDLSERGFLVDAAAGH